MQTDQDNNGYLLIFLEDVKQVKQERKITDAVRIENRTPTSEEYLQLVTGIGWFDEAQAKLVDRVLSVKDVLFILICRIKKLVHA
jgi:hypothetical protein